MKNFWRKWSNQINLGNYSFPSIQDRFLDLSESAHDDMLEGFCVGSWAMWNDRNHVVHENRFQI